MWTYNNGICVCHFNADVVFGSRTLRAQAENAEAHRVARGANAPLRVVREFVVSDDHHFLV